MEEWLEATLGAELRRDLASWRNEYPWTGTRALPSPVYRYHGREIFEAAVAALLAGEHLLLVGPKATGKNVLAENLAAAFGRPMFNVSLHINTDAAYLIGTAVAMVSGIAAISLLKYISQKGKFGGFAYYCWVVGVLSIILTVIF